MSDARAFGYLSFPQVSMSIEGAADTYVTANTDISKRVSYSTDRITIFRFLCGIPLVAYKGVANYIGPYHGRVIIGSHLYEGAAGDARDSRTYRVIFPFSAKAESALTQAERESVGIYDRAIAQKVITTASVGASTEYHINIFDGAVLDQWGNELDEVRTKRPGSLRATYQDYSSRELPVLSHRVIPNTGAAGYTDKGIRDPVIGSLLDMQILTEQLSLVDKFNEALECAREELYIGES